MCYSNRISSALVLMGALVIGAAPVWAQYGSSSEKSGSSATQDQSRGSATDKTKNSSKSQSGSSSDQGVSQGSRTGTGSAQSGRSSDTGMSSSGSASSDTSSAGSSSSGMSSSSRSGAMTAGSEDVKRVQQALKEQGQDPGPIDRSEERRVGKECRSRWS